MTKFISFKGINMAPNGVPQSIGEVVVRSDTIVLMTQAMVQGKLSESITLLQMQGGAVFAVEGSIEQVQAMLEEREFS